MTRMSTLLFVGIYGVALLLNSKSVQAVNLAVEDGVQVIGVMQEGGRIIWHWGSHRDIGRRIHDNGVTNSALLYVDPLSLIPYRGTGYYFGGIARGITQIEMVENFQRVVNATVYYDGGSQAFGPLTPLGAGTHVTTLKLDSPVDTRFIYVDVSEIDGGGGREDIVDIRELRVEGLEITPSSLQAVDHTPRGTHWTFVGPDFRHNWTKFASSVETAKFTNAYNSANLMGGADSLDLDLGRQVVTVAIGINQAPSLQNGDLYNMIRQARLEFFQDADFNTLVATRNVDLDNFRTFQLLDYEPVNARYVRLTANSLYLGDINELGISGVLFAPDPSLPDLAAPPHILSVEQESIFDPVHPGDPYSLTVTATHPDGLKELSVMIWRSRYGDHRGREERMAHVRLLPTGQANEFRANFTIPETILGGEKRLPDGTYQLVITGFRKYQPVGVLRFTPGPGEDWGGRVDAFDYPQDAKPLDITLRVRNRREPTRSIQCVMKVLDSFGKPVMAEESRTLKIVAGQTVSQSFTVKPLPQVPRYHLEVVLTEPETGAEQVLALQREVPTPKDTIPLERLNQLVSREVSSSYSPQRVISPRMPIAIRQEDPNGPRYQEGLSYTFLIHSMKFSKLARLDNGRIVLLSNGWIHKGDKENRAAFILYSDDEANGWSQPREIPDLTQQRARPVSLGGQRLMAFGGVMMYSDDGGETWTDPVPNPLRLPNGQQTAHHGSILAEGDELTIISASEAPPHGLTGWTGYSWLWRSHDSGRTWDAPLQIPVEWNTSEGSVTRAKDGALVGSFRTNQAPGLPSHCDHWRRITTARSMDNGHSWTDHQVHFKYGKVHTKLLTLQNGDILMTYAVRMGELDGEMYHGIEAVLSRDNGRTWDWDQRFILFRWAMNQFMHTPESLELADGQILTVFTYHYHPSWGPSALGAPGYPMGLTSAVIWSPK